MVDLFFNNASIYAGLVRYTANGTRIERIDSAQLLLEQLSIEITHREQKLKEILAFLNQKKIEYTALCACPQESITQRLETLQQGIDQLEITILQTQPEQKIADLRTRYEILKTKLFEKI